MSNYGGKGLGWSPHTVHVYSSLQQKIVTSGDPVDHCQLLTACMCHLIKSCIQLALYKLHPPLLYLFQEVKLWEASQYGLVEHVRYLLTTGVKVNTAAFVSSLSCIIDPLFFAKRHA